MCKISEAAKRRWSDPEERKKQSIRTSGRVGQAASRSRTWSLESPRKTKRLTSSLRQFCEINGLSYTALKNKFCKGDTNPISRGPSKGWSVLSCTDKD
jgi:hypothetical protein